MHICSTSPPEFSLRTMPPRLLPLGQLAYLPTTEYIWDISVDMPKSFDEHKRNSNPARPSRREEQELWILIQQSWKVNGKVKVTTELVTHRLQFFFWRYVFPGCVWAELKDIYLTVDNSQPTLFTLLLTHFLSSMQRLFPTSPWISFLTSSQFAFFKWIGNFVHLSNGGIHLATANAMSPCNEIYRADKHRRRYSNTHSKRCCNACCEYPMIWRVYKSWRWGLGEFQHLPSQVDDIGGIRTNYGFHSYQDSISYISIYSVTM